MHYFMKLSISHFNKYTGAAGGWVNVCAVYKLDEEIAGQNRKIAHHLTIHYFLSL